LVESSDRNAVSLEAVPLDRMPDFDRAAETAVNFVANVETVIHGKSDEIKLVLAAMACGGHVLLEDVPGTAKTVLARSFARTIVGATTGRIQCTPDLQPIQTHHASSSLLQACFHS
jgi:MoxR-like ATPase